MKSSKTILVGLIFVVVIGIIGQFIWGRKELPQESNSGQGGREYVAEKIKPSLTIAPSKPFLVSIDMGGDKNYKAELTAIQTPFEALKGLAGKEKLEVKIKQYKFGVMVTKVGDKESSSEEAWIYYINGKAGTIASDRQVVFPGDKIEWRFEKIQK